jgi:hypothetical protein
MMKLSNKRMSLSNGDLGHTHGQFSWTRLAACTQRVLKGKKQSESDVKLTVALGAQPRAAPSVSKARKEGREENKDRRPVLRQTRILHNIPPIKKQEDDHERLDCLPCVRAPISRHFQTFSDIFRHFQTFSDIFKPFHFSHFSNFARRQHAKSN